jgi:ATP phosphoribosyltransferase
MQPDDLQLPFVGPARAQQICDLATTGTTLELEQHR